MGSSSLQLPSSYQNGAVDEPRPSPTIPKRNLTKLVLMGSLGVVVLLAAMDFLVKNPTATSSTSESIFKFPLMDLDLDVEGKHKSHQHKIEGVMPPSIPMPYGVNFGSWLSLEDYFFVGDTGAVQVATPDQNTAAVCLPPLHTGQGPAWQSETDLLTYLIQTTGLKHAIKIFHAHRTSFVTEYDLEKLSHWGVKHVRIPLNWCFTDSRVEDITVNSTDEELRRDYTCADPYYEGVLWPAIPKSFLTSFLRKCAHHGIRASLDLHTYPGATSPGTFSGLWPKDPRFWLHDNPEDPENDLGRTLYRQFIDWIETLPHNDPEAFQGISGISPMNEPAHLAGVFRETPRNYLPPLSEKMLKKYMKRLNHNPDILDGPHMRVFLWLQDAIDYYKQSSLPKLGKQLHLNVHESVLTLPKTYDAPKKPDDNPAMNFIAAWWSEATTRHDRVDWAVLDVHHYHAWSPECQGASDGPPEGNYTCTDDMARAETLKRCSAWAKKTYRRYVNHHCEESAQLMTGEFSTSTHHSVRHACNDMVSLREMYLTQIEAAQQGNVHLYYWSYKMPHGGAFKYAWSFSQFLYLMGINPHPDVSNYNCGGRYHHAGEVTDDWFR